MNDVRVTRFPVQGIFWFVLVLWLCLAAAVALVVIGIAVLGTVTGSVWDYANSVTTWFSLGFTSWLTYTYLPVYLAHGITRREYIRLVLGFVLLLTAQLAVLNTVAYLAEAGVFALADWPQEFAPQRQFSSVGELPTLLLTQLLAICAHSALGAVLGAAFYRENGVGLLLILPGLAAMALVNSSTGVWTRTFSGDLDWLMPSSPAAGALICLALIGLEFAAVWLLLRRAPARPVSV